MHTKEPDALGDRYLEIMQFRDEVLKRYRASHNTILGGPKTRIVLPEVRASAPAPGSKSKSFGPFTVSDRPPVVALVEELIEHSQRPMRILEIGPGRGELATRLRRRFPERIEAYYALDRDRSFAGPWHMLTDVTDVPEIDLVIASEVIEHLPADEFVADMLLPLRHKLSKEGAFVITTPNPTAPGGIARDFTHCQRYPWYDLYAIFRLAFNEVEVSRAYYAYTPTRLLALVPRIMLCLPLELEWAETLCCVARRARA